MPPDGKPEDGTWKLDAFAGDGVRIVYEDAARCIGVCENVIFTIEDAEPPLEYLDELRRIVLNLGEKSGKTLALLFLISSRCKPPSDAVRAQIERDRQALEPFVKAGAHVVFGEGFRAAAKRSVLSLLFATSRHSFPVKVFAEVDPALAWLVKSLGDAAPRPAITNELAPAVAGLCRARFTTT
ncbi:MAG TPA: hypothetical protein VI072_18040 [Polyangiaceae bacterium]